MSYITLSFAVIIACLINLIRWKVNGLWYVLVVIQFAITAALSVMPTPAGSRRLENPNFKWTQIYKQDDKHCFYAYQDKNGTTIYKGECGFTPTTVTLYKNYWEITSEDVDFGTLRFLRE